MRRILAVLAVLAVAGLVVSIGRDAQSQNPRRLLTDLSALFNTSTNLDSDVDVSAADGAEHRIEPDGDLRTKGQIEVGGIGTGEGCLSRDTSTTPDKLFVDFNCGKTKDGSDCYIDECGGTASAAAAVDVEMSIGTSITSRGLVVFSNNTGAAIPTRTATHDRPPVGVALSCSDGSFSGGCAPGELVTVRVFGLVDTLDTSALGTAAGQPVCVTDAGGAPTFNSCAQETTGPSHVGTIMSLNASTGSIFVVGGARRAQPKIIFSSLNSCATGASFSQPTQRGDICANANGTAYVCAASGGCSLSGWVAISGGGGGSGNMHTNTYDIGVNSIVDRAEKLDAASATAQIMWSSTRDCYVHDDDDDGTADNRETCARGRFGVRDASAFLGGGTNYGAAVNAAIADCRSDGSLGCVIDLPRGELAQDTMIDACDASGQQLGQHAIHIRGHGANMSGGYATRLRATASLRPAASSFDFDVDADVTVAGASRDTITCSGCDFRALGYRRGDLIVTSGFTDAANNIVQTSGELPLLVWRAEASRLVVEAVNAADAGLVDESDATTESIQRLVPQIRSCTRRVSIEGVYLDGVDGNRYSDLGILFWADNFPNQECSASTVPYAHCTGDGTGSALGVSVTYAWAKDGVSANQKWVGVAFLSTSSSGQQDNSGTLRWDSVSSPITYWIDSFQGQPAIALIDSDAGFYEKTGIYVSAGGVDVRRGTFGGTDSDCTDDTYGECWMGVFEGCNRDNSIFDNTALEISTGDGFKVLPCSGLNTAPLALRDLDFIVAYNGGATPVKMLDWDASGRLVLDGVELSTTSDVTTAAPTVTIASSFESTNPLKLYADPIFTAAGAALKPVMSIGSGIYNDAGWCYNEVTASPTASTDRYVAKARRQFTVTNVDCIITGTTNIPVTVQKCGADGTGCNTMEAAITCDGDGAAHSGVIDDSFLGRTEWLKLDFGTPSGTPDSATVQVCGY